jgi:choline dehydrogenase-like flavoprotein
LNRVLVVGAGAGGAIVARELAEEDAVTVLEAGASFRPFAADLDWLARLGATGLFLDEHMIRFSFPAAGSTQSSIRCQSEICHPKSAFWNPSA